MTFGRQDAAVVRGSHHDQINYADALNTVQGVDLLTASGPTVAVGSFATCAPAPSP